MRRHLCIWFPDFALENQQRRQHPLSARQIRPAQEPVLPDETDKPDEIDLFGEKAFVLVIDYLGARRLWAVNAAARSLGLYAGMGLADARAIAPDLHHSDADTDADRAFIIRLAHWSRRWCPWTSPLNAGGEPFNPHEASPPITSSPTASSGAAGLVLDITGSDHLFGGENVMLKGVINAFHRLGLTAYGAIADSLGGAYALAYSNRGTPFIAAPSALKTALAPLPIKALRLDHAMLVSLSRLGLKHIEQVAALPRPALARRFKSDKTLKGPKGGRLITGLLKRLDQALGKQAEPFTPLVEPANLSVRLPLLEPILHAELLLTVASDGLDKLLPMLEAKGLGIKRLEMACYRVDASRAEITISCARASLDKAHIIRLLPEKSAHIDAGFGIETIVLSALETAPLNRDQISSLAPSAADPHSMDKLADRLTARLGQGAVVALAHKASWLPERAQRFVEWHQRDNHDTDFKKLNNQGRRPTRPERLLMRPEPVEVLAEVPEGPPIRFRWRRQMLIVRAAEGPERLAPEWWLSIESDSHNSEEPRDYFRTELEDGRRLWLYRRGLFPHRAGLENTASANAPRWFVHGLFA